MTHVSGNKNIDCLKTE